MGDFDKEQMMDVRNDYTPTTQNIRDCYVYADANYGDDVSTPIWQSNAEFDRWLKTVIADAKAEQRETDAQMILDGWGADHDYPMIAARIRGR